MAEVYDDEPPGALLETDPAAPLVAFQVGEVPKASPFARQLARLVALRHQLEAPPQVSLPDGGERCRRAAEPQGDVVVTVNGQCAGQPELRERPPAGFRELRPRLWQSHRAKASGP